MIRMLKVRLFVCLIVVLAAGSSAFASADFYFPQTAVGTAGDISILTRFTITRFATGNPDIEISFFDDAGQPWTLDVASAERPELNGSWSSRTFNFVGRTTVTFVVSSNAGIAAGWTRLSSTSRILASSSYLAIEQDSSAGAGDPAKPLWEAGLLPSPSATQYYFAVDNKTDRVVKSTGLAMSNPSSVSTTVTLRLYDSAGTLVSTKTVSLPSHGHNAQFLSQIFTDVNMDGFVGWVDVNSPVAVAVSALQGSAGASTTVYSAIPLGVTRQDAAYMTVYDTEVNDTFETRQGFMLPAEIRGTANSSVGGADIDYYSFSTSAGQVICVTVLTDSINSQLAAPVVELYDLAQHLLVTATALSAGADDQTLQFPVTSSGGFILKISSASGAPQSAYRAYVIAE